MRQQQIHTLLECWIPSRKQPFCLCWCTCSVVHDGKDLSIFVWSPAVNDISVIEFSNHGPVSRGLPVNGRLHTNLLLLSSLIKLNKFLSLGCQLGTYPWPRLINCGSSGCNLDFVIFNTCQGNIISSKKTKHSSVISSTEAVGDNWACQTHGDSSKLVQFEMETSHVHSKYLIIPIRQALFFNSKHSCQVLNENNVYFMIWLILFFCFSLSIQKHVARPVKVLWNTVFAISEAMV